MCSMVTRKVLEKKLSKTDANVRLHVPFSSLWAFPIAEGAHQFDFDAIDTSGVTWPFRLSTRSKGVYSKHVLTRHYWLAFSKKKHLQQNDRIILSMNEEVDGTMFRIQEQRNLIKIFGKDIWFNVEDLHHYGIN